MKIAIILIILFILIVILINLIIHSLNDQISGEDCGGSMEYNWLTSHDPITIDANLAEIDFDDFKNEDIQNAYAFSLQSYVSIYPYQTISTILGACL